MADRSLSFNVAAIDRTAKSFEKIALRLDKLSEKLDRLDAKRVNIPVDVDTRSAEQKLDRFKGSLEKGFSSLPTWLDPRFVAAGAAAFVAAMPLVGAAAATAFVLAFGAGLAGIGILVASKNKGVQKTYDKLGKHISKTFGKAAGPFEHALQAIAPILGHLADKLAPVFRQIGKILGPALIGFAQQLSRAFSNPAFTKGLEAMAQAFAGILRQLGPKLPGLFKSIGQALQDLGDTASKNSDLLASMIAFLFKVVYVVLRIIDGFTIMYAWVVNNAPKIAAVFLHVFDMILGGAVKAFDWIPGLGPKLDAAYKKFHSWAAKTATDLNNLPKIHKVKADITDLKSKLSEAKARLKDPTLTKAQRKKILGDIRDLKHKIAEAKAKLFQLTHQNWTVTVHGRYYFTRPPGFVGPVVPHRAAGGPVTRGRSYLVGENGPEMFTPGESGNVTSNDELGGGAKEVVIPIYIGDEVVRVVRRTIAATDSVKKQRTLARSGSVR